MNPEQTIRLECLKLAVSKTTTGPTDTCAVAGAYADFVRGADNPATAGPAPAHPGKPQDKGRSPRA